MNWEIGIDIYTLICIKWIANKNLLYKKINKIKLKKKKRSRVTSRAFGNCIVPERQKTRFGTTKILKKREAGR